MPFVLLPAIGGPKARSGYPGSHKCSRCTVEISERSPTSGDTIPHRGLASWIVIFCRRSTPHSGSCGFALMFSTMRWPSSPVPLIRNVTWRITALVLAEQEYRGVLQVLLVSSVLKGSPPSVRRPGAYTSPHEVATKDMLDWASRDGVPHA